VTEVKEGRGCGPKADHVLLKVDHLGEAIISKRLPGIRESGKIFAGVDAVVEPLPVFPTAHYVMGGIPTDRYGRVLTGEGDTVMPGLYAAGECACVSVHGANRLGGNSLLDILVFGRAAGLNVLENNPAEYRPMPQSAIDQATARLERWEKTDKGLSIQEFRDEFRKVMEDHAGVFRTEEIMQAGVDKLIALREKLPNVRLHDHSKVFNTARIEALELENLFDCGISIAISALRRQESRGAHSRPDYPERNDADWMKHSLYYLEGDRMEYKPVTTKPLSVETFPPKARTY
jgi:succinate dehydrogenase / fumarate reductase flavoprotein subunit